MKFYVKAAHYRPDGNWSSREVEGGHTKFWVETIEGSSLGWTRSKETAEAIAALLRNQLDASHFYDPTEDFDDLDVEPDVDAEPDVEPAPVPRPWGGGEVRVAEDANINRLADLNQQVTADDIMRIRDQMNETIAANPDLEGVVIVPQAAFRFLR